MELKELQYALKYFEDNKNKIDDSTVEKTVICLLQESIENIVGILDNNFWKSKDGKVHKFEDMQTAHLGNAIGILKNNYSKEKLIDSTLFKGLSQEFMIRNS